MSGEGNFTDLGAVLITGGAKRIGREIALTLAKTRPVIIHYHNSAKQAQDLATIINDNGLSAHTIKADLNDPQDVDTLFDRAEKTSKIKIKALVNNASIFEEDTALTANKSSFDNHMNINLWAPLRLSQCLAKGVDKGSRGHIINIIDQRVLSPSSGFTSYTLSKAALLAQTQNLAKELAPQVQVNAVAPGPVLRSIHQNDKDFANEVASLPLQKHPTEQDIARAVLFLLDNEAITGEMITLDGGQHLL